MQQGREREALVALFVKTFGTGAGAAPFRVHPEPFGLMTAPDLPAREAEVVLGAVEALARSREALGTITAAGAPEELSRILGAIADLHVQLDSLDVSNA